MEPKPFLKTRFRAIPVEAAEGDHWQGGRAYHRGAACPTCKIPLLLLWDINCRDRRFPRRKFGPLERLPLYYCWGCVCDISYQVIAPDRIKVVPNPVRKEQTRSHTHRCPCYQYENYPQHFERRALALVPGVPDNVRAILLAWDMDRDTFRRRASKKKKQVLAEYFGHPAPMPLCWFHHQFGGVPSQRWWREEVLECPNRQCQPERSGKLPGKKRLLKFLAGILNDPWHGLPMVEEATDETRRQWNYFVSVQFHICNACWTIYACTCCD